MDPGSHKQRIVLATLLCRANSVVPVGALAEALWDDAPPRTARKNIQVYVSALRGVTGAGLDDRISYRNGGYVFHASAGDLDSLSFAELARARHAPRRDEQPATTARVLGEALALWRGPVLDGMRDVPVLDAAARRLEGEFLAVFEDWAEAEIAAGGAAGAIERITDVARAHPLRERLRILQMTALSLAGRRAEALAVFDELRQSLARELGLSPSPAVVRCHQSLLDEQAGAARRPATPGLLPWDLPLFTGRTELTRDLSGSLAAGGSQLTVLTGPVGAGKTALAVHVAHQLGAEFPDGRFLVRLRDSGGRLRPPEEVLTHVLLAAAPGPPPPSGPSGLDGHRAGQLSRAWQFWLARHRALVIIDDARQESEAGPLLPEAGDSAVIVTARYRLAGGALESACRHPVSPFTVAEAVDFLGRIIGPGRVAADPAAAERVAAAAGLTPLGIRLAGDRLALLPHLPVREYAARLESTTALLDELTTGDPPVLARLAHAVGEQPGPVREAVARLAWLPDPVFTPLEAAEALGADAEAAERLLEVLLEASLVTVPDVETLAHAVLYEMPTLIRAHARAAHARPAPAFGTRT